ncbi:MAG: hypothetical protein HY077_08335 [Elusimicrobia bacterium]|nr:hypothetical protein [Elusimicrobiota bacterium]
MASEARIPGSTMKTKSGETKVIRPKPFDSQEASIPLIIGLLMVAISFQDIQKHPGANFELLKFSLVCAITLVVVWNMIFSNAWVERHSLTLTDDGLTIGPNFYSWSSIERFGVEKGGSTPAPSSAYLIRNITNNKRIYWIFKNTSNRANATRKARIPAGDYKMVAGELAALLNERLQHHTGRKIKTDDVERFPSGRLIEGVLGFTNILTFAILAVFALLLFDWLPFILLFKP